MTLPSTGHTLTQANEYEETGELGQTGACSNVSILVVISSYSFTRWDHWGAKIKTTSPIDFLWQWDEIVFGGENSFNKCLWHLPSVQLLCYINIIGSIFCALSACKENRLREIPNVARVPGRVGSRIQTQIWAVSISSVSLNSQLKIFKLTAVLFAEWPSEDSQSGVWGLLQHWGQSNYWRRGLHLFPGEGWWHHQCLWVGVAALEPRGRI